MDVREKLVEILKQAPFEGKVLDEWWWEEKIRIIADHLISNGVTVQEWIPVTERLPKNEKPVLTFVGYEESMIGFITVSSYFCFEHNPHWQWDGLLKDEQKTLFWMPLPKPPKGE